MLNFKKVFNLKIISILGIAMLLFNSIAYGIDLPQKSFLRKPLDFNSTSGAGNRFQDVLRIEEQEQIREMLRDPFLNLDEETIDFIIQDIAKRGGLFIDADGAVHGSKSTLRLISGMRKVSMGELLQESLFHEGVHKLLQLILYYEPKRLFLQEIGEELGAGYSFKSANLKDDVIKIMGEVFGEFESENALLEELVAKYYTYRFCGRDSDVFKLPEMQRAELIIESSMGKHYYGIADDAEKTKKSLNTLFSIKGEKTKKARIAKLKELSKESEEWGGEFNITFEQRNEAVARLDKALGQLFLKNYPIIPVFRRMRHGGSVYDVERKVSGASEDLGQIIYYWEEGQDEELKDEFKNFLSTLQANYVGFQKLIREPSINLELKIEKSTILKWEDGLKHNLEIFRKTRNDFNALVENAGRHNLSVDMRDTIGTFSEMAKNQLDEIIHILEQGADLINGVVVAEEIDLGETIKEAIKSHGSYVEYKESPGLTIFADSMMVQQIITNILFNIDNIKTEKEITRVVIAARLSEDWKNVIIEIIDNGLGFPEEMLSKTPRSDGSYEVIFGLNMTYRKGGSGFGLAENDFYAMLNNGSFRVFSRPSGNHGGSTFTIKLPVVLSPEKQRVDSAFFESKETEPEIIEKMKQSISSLTELWRSYPPKAAYMNSALLTAEQILVLFFGGDVISNNLAVIRLYLQSYEQRKKRGEVAVEIEENKIRDRFETCDKIITRYDNILLEKLQDDTLINNYITYLFEHPVYNSGRITEEGIIDMDNLKPEQIRHIIQRYINDLKPVVESLKIDFDKLMQVIHEEIPNIDSAKKNQTSL